MKYVILLIIRTVSLLTGIALNSKFISRDYARLSTELVECKNDKLVSDELFKLKVDQLLK